MIRQGRTIDHTGWFTTWDGDNITEVMDIAGDKFIELASDSLVLIRTGDDGNEAARLLKGQMIARYGDLVVVYSGDLGPKMIEVVSDAE